MRDSERHTYTYGLMEPKPFAYVDLPEKVDRTRYVSHEKVDDLTGRLKLNIQVASDYLFVGSGGYDFRENDRLVYYGFFRSNGTVAVPGSSIKGAVRNVVEAISNSCVSQGKRKEGFDSHEKCRDIKHLCPSCKVFGTTGYSGRVSFSDAPLEKGDLEIVKIGELYRPQISQGKRKFYQNKRLSPVGNLKAERNYRFVEAVRKGSTFATMMNFQTLSDAELSLVLYSMGMEQEYMIKVGGAKPRCFGTVKFQAVEIDLLNKSTILTSESMFEHEDPSWISEIMRNDGLLNQQLFGEFKEAMKTSSDMCPKVNY